MTDANRDLSLLSADLVLGQPNFYSTGANRDPVGRNIPLLGLPRANTLSFDRPSMVFDHNGSLWISDKENNRVLRYAPPFSNGMNASLVLGQPDFESYDAGQPTASSLSGPVGLAFDFGQDGVGGNEDDRLWVADGGRHRLLRFDPPFRNGMAASAVLGAPDFESVNLGCLFSHPWDVEIDPDGNLWVAEWGIPRILMFRIPLDASEPIPCVNQSPDGVLGQDSFKGGGRNRGQERKAVRNGFSNTRDMAFDADGNLWVVDNDNERVVRYNAPFDWTGPVPGARDGADIVLGQPDFVSNDPKRGLDAVTEWGFAQPTAVAVDPEGNVWVVDLFGRVLRFDAPIDETGPVPGAADLADAVIGQPNFRTGAPNRGQPGPRPDGLAGIEAIVIDPEGNVWVGSRVHDRVLRFPVASLSERPRPQ
jgi:streptogramin lyase